MASGGLSDGNVRIVGHVVLSEEIPYAMTDKILYYGDNLDVLKRGYVKEESVDLVYLDPPFKSNQDYNVLFAEPNKTKSRAQIKAFEDTWSWDLGAAESYDDVIAAGGRTAESMIALYKILGTTDMMAYLAMMAPRLKELHKVLKPTGSIYLHCDPTASHYLKILMDAVFGPEHFRSEVIWKRTSAHSNPKRWAPVHDVLLFYSKSTSYTWNHVTQDYEKEYLDTKYRNHDDRGNYRLTDLTGAGPRSGDSGKPWREFDPSKSGRHWGVPRGVVEDLVGEETAASMTSQEKLDLLDKHHYIYWTPKGKKGGVGFPQLKRYLTGGVPIADVIADIPPINSQAQERLGYPTQKPEALLERVINASSNPGDIVLDPFCGCGTTIAVAERLKRTWLGIDITHLAIGLIKHRLFDAHGFEQGRDYVVVGEPTDLSGAEALAKQDRYQFQAWALGLVGARQIEQKKGADKGIDGRLYFNDEHDGSKTKEVIFSVKSGHTGVADVRDLRGVIEREKAAIGVLLSFEEPTHPMRSEAADAGFYMSPWGTKHPRMQILTVAELLAGKKVSSPPPRQVNVTFKKAPRAKAMKNGMKAKAGKQNAKELPFG